LASDTSLERSINRVVKHYSSLFALPSYLRIVLYTFLLCVACGVFTVFVLDVSLSGIVLALQFSLFLFLLSAASDLIARQTFMKSDLIYNTRRCAALSMFSILLWFGFLLVGSLLTILFTSRSLWVYLFSVGFAAVCILRLIVFFSTSFASSWRAVGASLTQPIVCLLPSFYVGGSAGYALGNTKVAYFLFSIPLSVFTAFVFMRTVDRVGDETFRTPTTAILKAFLTNWLEGLNAPLENLFEKFGGVKTIDFSLLAFKAEDHVESVAVVSSFHPGPFKNVGSSLLPFMIQEALEKKLHCVVLVPHGLFGHEFDLSSQQQNQKVLGSMFDAADFAEFGSKATSFAMAQEGFASACCQVFGDCAVLVLTLAPETTEDFPREVGDFIHEQASKLGLVHVIIVNAHNSINNPFDANSAVESMKEAAFEALKQASRLKPSPFEAGAAKVVPKEFSLKDGMGPGGICALVIKVGKQTCAYVTIDGNNMVSGLREKILKALGEMGVDAGEVLTTDTHAVNAVVMTARGYHPLGEAIPYEKLISNIKDSVREALNNIKPASVAWRVGRVSDVRVIGENQIQEMSLLADRALQRAKKTAVPLFAVVGSLLVALLAVL